MNEAIRNYHIAAHAFTADRLTPGLYLVPTPIGNLGDITIRALQVLAAADFIYCEDTRVTVKLLDRYGIRGRLKSYHDYNTEISGKVIMLDINAGHAIALCSDAGTPLISDPGFPLVRDCIAAGLKIEALPGASALLPSLQLAGFPTDRFTFLGFLPQKQSERLRFLQDMALRTETLVVYESPHRILDCLVDMEATFASRRISVSREISKLHEETLRGTAGEILAILKPRPTIRGEFVVVVEPQEPVPEIASDAEIQQAIESALKDNPASKAAGLVSKKHNLPRDDIYARILSLKGKT